MTFPARPPTCDLAIRHTATPGVPTWHDLGIAEVTCHIDVGLPQCVRRFRAEACRMGGDIIYAVPEKPLRPREQAVVYRGRVAHTRWAPPKDESPRKKQDDARPQAAAPIGEPPPPAPVEPPPTPVDPSPETVEPPGSSGGW